MYKSFIKLIIGFNNKFIFVKFIVKYQYSYENVFGGSTFVDGSLPLWGVNLLMKSIRFSIALIMKIHGVQKMDQRSI